MSSGWGYGKNYSLLDENKLKKSFENNKLKVYKAKIIYMGYLQITYIIDKETKHKTVILKYDNRKPENYDVTQYKSKKSVVEYITNYLLEDYYNIS